ncbi:MAG: hypothetical protein HY556_08575 [Euryarchaeota archaeon]|nr:hypothetical protein [Euryarchaeota archaeon]
MNIATSILVVHEDASQKGHSANKDSVMYWAVDSTNVLAAFGLDDIPDDFDLEDKNDLRAIR